MPLTAPPATVQAYAATLHATETARADAFFHEGDRLRYIVAHGALRGVLGGYLGCAPVDVELEHRAAGKPVLVAPLHLHFSLSHGGATGLLAVAADRSVGVDVEHVANVHHPHAIARRWFSAREAQLLVGAEPGRAATSFLRLWTAKESCVKETGAGLAALPEVVVAADGRHASDATRRWSLSAVPVWRDHVATLAVQGVRPVLAVRPLRHAATPAELAVSAQIDAHAAGVSA
ncbi:MAG TPA: 4'-phosphopantetheinyl transferase superfamily protein [Solirubrobacteraceae bacterium]|jgi:4'-phosphopantetheinyl transferase|nr:4'-phosphopantetheinyl transferase superfamily protein [Solirubrobacteraceae bacterium]